jgi:hypothetical protein
VQASPRDALGRTLGQTAAAKLRQRAASARRHAPPVTPGAMPPPSTLLRRKPDGTPSRVPLSSAGRKLAQTLHGRGASAADAQLRASYSGTPTRRPGAGSTPLHIELRRSAAATPVRAPVPASGTGSLTDDLLKI